MNIIVLGAGTAGLVSALVLKKTYPLYNISVIESSTIGIIGVGEGSTEHWKTFIDYCDINVHQLVRETDAALKKGIKFENWNGDGLSYFHSISDPFYTEFSHGHLPNARAFAKTLISNDVKTEDVLLDTNLVQHYGGIQTTNQYHFNTFKLNEYLHKICSERGITFTNATITDVNVNEVGDVVSLVSDSGIHEADFFVDSSGMKRVISSKLGAKWVSYKKYLPMNHALAFPTDDVRDLKPYTLSRALSSGWNWRISTQGRYGNGYVFCDDFIDSDKAHAEIQSVYTEEVKVAKDIKFEAGRVDKFWINNCLSIGLSASFVEPLEASSIGNSILQAFGLVNMLDHWMIDRKISETYNRKFTSCFDNIVDFVQLHYMTKRKDTDFWRAVPSMMEMTDFNKEYLHVFAKTLPTQSVFLGEYNMFNASNYTQVMHGLGLLDSNYIKEQMMISLGEVDKEQMMKYNQYLTDVEKGVYIDHKILLEQNKYVVKLDRV